MRNDFINFLIDNEMLENDGGYDYFVCPECFEIIYIVEYGNEVLSKGCPFCGFEWGVEYGN